jgi:hypothetical protein
MNKDDKPVERELARGSVLPQELVQLLALGAADATYTSIRVHWSDGHTSRIGDISELAPIEDVTHLAYVRATFTYEDRSELTITLPGYSANTVTAVGQTARTRQSALCEYWATVPGRSRINFKHTDWLFHLSLFLLFSSSILFFVTLLNRELRTSATAAAIDLSFCLFAWCVWFFLRSLPGRKAVGHLVVMSRPSRVDMSKVIAALTGVGGFVLAIIAYLYPRK